MRAERTPSGSRARSAARPAAHTAAWSSVLTGAILHRVYRVWCRTLRYTEINRAAIETHTRNGRPVVLCLWHDELFPLIYLKDRKSVV